MNEVETLSGFVEDAVRRNVEYRQAQTTFVGRGLASRDAARASGRCVKAGGYVTILAVRHLREDDCH